jgi:DNA polymerase-3 subunit alpha
VALPSLISIKVRINGNGSEKAQALHQLFERKKGEAEVRLRLEKPREFAVVMDVTTRVRPDKEFRAEVERICGPESLEVLAN